MGSIAGLVEEPMNFKKLLEPRLVNYEVLACFCPLPPTQ